MTVKMNDTDWPPSMECRTQCCQGSGVITTQGNNPRNTRLGGCICRSTRRHLTLSSVTGYSLKSDGEVHVLLRSQPGASQECGVGSTHLMRLLQLLQRNGIVEKRQRRIPAVDDLGPFLERISPWSDSTISFSTRPSPMQQEFSREERLAAYQSRHSTQLAQPCVWSLVECRQGQIEPLVSQLPPAWRISN